MKYIGGQMIKPRCLLYNMPMFLSADNKLKPCCFLNPTYQWNQFKEWGKQNGLNVEEDLDITKHSVDTIIKSPTWLAVLDGFETGNGKESMGLDSAYYVQELTETGLLICSPYGSSENSIHIMVAEPWLLV